MTGVARSGFYCLGFLFSPFSDENDFYSTLYTKKRVGESPNRHFWQFTQLIFTNATILWKIGKIRGNEDDNLWLEEKIVRFFFFFFPLGKVAITFVR